MGERVAARELRALVWVRPEWPGRVRQGHPVAQGPPPWAQALRPASVLGPGPGPASGPEWPGPVSASVSEPVSAMGLD